MLGTALRRRALCAAVIASAVAVGGVAAVTPASATLDTTVVEISGDAADTLTEGQSRGFAPPAATITVTGTTASVQVSVVGSETWDFTVVAPTGQQLAAGTTYDTVEPASVTDTVAGLSLAGAGRSCTTSAGTVTILELATDAGTGDVTGFAATFESRCDGAASAAARGAVYVHSTLAYAARSALTLTSPTASAYAGDPVDLSGVLTGPGGPIAGATVALSRTDGAGTTDLPAATTGADGSYAATVALGSSDATFTASYAGDADHAAVQRTLDVAFLAPTTSSLTLTGPASAFAGATVAVSGVLSGPGGPVAGATVSLSRTDGAGTADLPAATTTDDGSYTASVPFGTSDATLTASYAGTPRHAAVQQTLAVALAPPGTTTLTLDGPEGALAGSTITLSGLLSGEGGGIAGATITLSRTDHDGTTGLAPAVTGADGAWTAQVPLGLSESTFTAAYAGDSSHGSVQATREVQATRTASRVTLVAPSTVKRAAAYVVSGVLSSGAVLANQTVVLRRTDLAGARSISVRTNASGVFSYRDVPAVGGVVSWRATWEGDATRQPASVSRNVTVLRLKSVITVRTSAAVYAYGARAVVTVHLGTTYNRRDVYVYARPLGAGFGGTRLLAHGKVNSAGNLVITYQMRTRTSFIVRFDGDYRYAAAVATTSAWAKAKVSINLVGWYARAGGVSLYHAVDPTQVITVAPNRPGRCYSTTVQALQAGVWSTIAKLSCGRLDFRSSGYTTLRTSRPTQVLFRIMASVGTDTVSQTLGSSSPWVYLQFT